MLTKQTKKSISNSTASSSKQGKKQITKIASKSSKLESSPSKLSSASPLDFQRDGLIVASKPVQSNSKTDDDVKLQKLNKLRASLTKLNNAFGRTVASLGSEREEVDLLEVGSSLGDLLVIKTSKGEKSGIPVGGITQFYGPRNSGKTLRALSIIANTQTHGGVCAFIDLSNSFDRGFAEHCGVDVESLILASPMNAEETDGVCSALMESGAVKLIVIDGLGALFSNTKLITKTDVIVNFARRLALLANANNVACVITRRVNPNRSFAPAGDAFLHSIAKTSIECYENSLGLSVRVTKHDP